MRQQRKGKEGEQDEEPVNGAAMLKYRCPALRRQGCPSSVSTRGRTRADAQSTQSHHRLRRVLILQHWDLHTVVPINFDALRHTIINKRRRPDLF